MTHHTSRPRFRGLDLHLAPNQLNKGPAVFCDGCYYWIFDYSLSSDGKRRRLPLEHPDASHRAFQNASEQRWVYPFTPGDSHTLELPELLRQLNASTFRSGESGQVYGEPPVW